MPLWYFVVCQQTLVKVCELQNNSVTPILVGGASLIPFVCVLFCQGRWCNNKGVGFRVICGQGYRLQGHLQTRLRLVFLRISLDNHTLRLWDNLRYLERN